MSVIILIDGREAVPVRAIPFVTGRTMSADIVAASLAMTDSVGRLDGVTGNRRMADGSIAPLLPKEWDLVEAELRALSARLKAKDMSHEESYAAWCRESVYVLPPAVFVWKEQFEDAFASAYSEDRMTLVDERPGERELNWTPLIPAELSTAVVEGFPTTSGPDAVDRATKASLTDKSLLGTVAALLACFPAGKSPSAKDLERAAETVGVKISDDTIRKVFAAARALTPKLPPA